MRRRRAAFAILLILIGICVGPAFAATTCETCDDVAEHCTDEVVPCAVCAPVRTTVATVDDGLTEPALVEGAHVITWAPKTSPPS